MAKNYDVLVNVTLQKRITVVGDDRADAKTKALQKWLDKEIDVDMSYFSNVDFRVINNCEKDIDVLLVKVSKSPEVIRLPNTMDSFQRFLGGSIRAVYPFNDSVAFICQEENMLYDLELNRGLYDNHGVVRNVIKGDFLVVATNFQKFVNLPKERIEYYSDYFKDTLKFFALPLRLLEKYGDTDKSMTLHGDENIEIPKSEFEEDEYEFYNFDDEIQVEDDMEDFYNHNDLGTVMREHEEDFKSGKHTDTNKPRFLDNTISKFKTFRKNK